jgi:hypothetical protein
MMAGGILRGDTRRGWLVVRDHGSWRGGVLYEARGWVYARICGRA